MIAPELLRLLRGHVAIDWHGAHGVSHWARVRAIGLRLAARTGARPRVVELFAFVHDACRQDEGLDHGHGRRSAAWIQRPEVRAVLGLDDADLALLVRACAGHSDGGTQEDVTVCTCWDADRLDLTVRHRLDASPHHLGHERGRVHHQAEQHRQELRRCRHAALDHHVALLLQRLQVRREPRPVFQYDSLHPAVALQPQGTVGEGKLRPRIGEMAAGKAPQDQLFRIGGMVKEGSVSRQADGVTIAFVVTDTEQDITVRYKGILPDLFKEGKGVVAQGRLAADGSFAATEVLAKHDENYMPPEAAEALKMANKGGSLQSAAAGASR